MTAILSCWVASFILESGGAFLYFRRNRLLSAILAFCAVTDFLAGAFKAKYSALTLYRDFAWSQLAIKEMLLLWLGCMICGMFVAEQDKIKTFLAAGFMSASSASMVTALAFSGEKFSDRVLNGAIAANGILLAVITLGWIGRKAMLNREWRCIVLGFLVLTGGDLVIAALWPHWSGAETFQALPTIAAYLIWVAGPILPYRLKDCRLSLGQRVQEAERVSVC